MEKPKPVVPPTPRQVAGLISRNKSLENQMRSLMWAGRKRRTTTLAMDVISTFCVVAVGFVALGFAYLATGHSAMCSTGIPMSQFSVGNTLVFTLCESTLMQVDLINPQSWTDPSIPDA